MTTTVAAPTGAEALLLTRRFALLFTTELIARTAYKIGKSPVLPVLALSLGAGDALLGIIVAVSTMTGIALKPLFGHLADRFGRRRFLWLALVVLILPCALYPALTTPNQLVALRLIHGMTTAILGPALLGHLIETGQIRRAEAFGWFGLARQISNVAGPLLGGLLLVVLTPANVYPVIALLAATAILPLLLLRNFDPVPLQTSHRFWPSASALMRHPAIVTAGLFEISATLVIYFYKAFLPVIAFRAGLPIVEIGAYLAAQELTTAALRPAAGRMADWIGHRVTLGTGLICLGLVAAAIPSGIEAGAFGALALALGIAQAVIQPALQAMIATTDAHRLSLAFGLVGAFRNTGKVAGPVLGGALSAWTSPSIAFAALGLLTCATGAALLPGRRRRIATD